MQAVAAVVSLIVAGVLAFLTYRYMKLTKGILDETSKARKANEDSARAALDSVKLMRQQLAEQTGLGAFIVTSTIDTAVTAIEPLLQPEAFQKWSAAESLSRMNVLLEQPADRAVTHAARINADAAKQLSSAFDLLRTACTHLQVLSNAASRGLGPGNPHFDQLIKGAQQPLIDAFAKFLVAKHELTQASGLPAPPSAPADIEKPKP